MNHAGGIVDTLMLNLMPRIKEDALSKPFTPERSAIIDQIDFVTDRMKEGMTFAAAVAALQ